MATMEDLIEIAVKHFGNDYVFSANKENIMYVCPFCFSKLGKVKTDRKLGVCVNPKSPHRLQWNCFRCGSSGKLEYNKRSIIDSIKGISIDKLLDQDDEYSSNEEYNMVYLPKAPIVKDSEGYNYLIKRGIGEDKIEYYGLREGTDKYSKRIIIPNKFYGANWVDVFQARDYTGNKEPKYLNPIGIDKSKIVFNLHRQEKNCKRLIVTEGAITAICGGKECVGVYGCHPSKSQLQQIIDYNPKELICCLDNDDPGINGLKQMLKDIKDLGYTGLLEYVIMPRGKDAADLGEQVFQEYVNKNKKMYNEFSFNLITKLV